MSIQKPMTARQKAYRKAQDEKWKKMTPEERAASRKKSKPQPKPKKRDLPKSAVKLIKKGTKKKK